MLWPTVTGAIGPPLTMFVSSSCQSIQRATPLRVPLASSTSWPFALSTWSTCEWKLAKSSVRSRTGAPKARHGYSHRGCGSTWQSLASIASFEIVIQWLFRLQSVLRGLPRLACQSVRDQRLVFYTLGPWFSRDLSSLQRHHIYGPFLAVSSRLQLTNVSILSAG